METSLKASSIDPAITELCHSSENEEVKPEAKPFFLETTKNKCQVRSLEEVDRSKKKKKGVKASSQTLERRYRKV